MTELNETQLQFPQQNKPAPAFNAKTTHGDRTLEDDKGKWFVLFSHSADFTPVCTTEFMGFANAADEFSKMNTELFGLSIDSIHAHIAWVLSPSVPPWANLGDAL